MTEPVKTIQRMPCGCQTQEFDDGRKVYAPCVPCAVVRAAWSLSRARRWWRRGRNLENAAQALAAMGATLVRERERLNLAAKVADALNKANKEEDN